MRNSYNSIVKKKKKLITQFQNTLKGFPGSSVVKNAPANAGVSGQIPDAGRCHMPWQSK